MADDKPKHKKTHKQKNKNKNKNKDSSDPASTNGAKSSSKRKRESEPGRKSKKNKHHDRDDRVNGTTLLIEPEVDQKPIITQLDGFHADGSAAPAADETPDSGLNGTPGKEKKLRKARFAGKTGKRIGVYEEDEIRAVEKYKVDFCNLHGIEAREFDAMVQHSEREGEEFPCPTDLCTKGEFWSSIYELMPDRDRRSVYRFMRRHFQDSDQKPHEWTAEQDEELIQLRAKHGPKYTLIAKLLGRSSDDVTQRWKNRLEHRTTMNHGAWSEQELRDLLRYLIQVSESSGKLRLSSDVYEMDDKLVPWGKISDQMNNTRSRQQCADRWRKIRKTVLETRATSDPNAVFDPRHSRGSEKPSTPKTPKSKEYVEESDSDDEGNESTQAAQETSATTESAPEADLGSQPVAGDRSESPNQMLVEEEASSSEDDGDEHFSPTTQRSKSASEKKQRKRQKKAREIEELAEAEGLTPAKANELRKQEKKRRKSLKEKRTSAVNKADIDDHTQHKQASSVQSQAGSDNDSDMSDLDDHGPIKMEG
ncbi:hypothetical protein N7509_008703 [Penicillium cosmopolitanum]|uniref:Myb-like domain-containing protein n=1 Tax=Penicillium cosmopolitanum TaxID=1131564 RepID=A0A9W9VN36_9EURO|nr:uncharacterized protein N7509_008703 [Penicillium cosmopolitanum]KAJ5386162.1 hypothetical protein N7509_008703 [Penicillium cosmopolitanum]